jgi:hypothetical protein
MPAPSTFYDLFQIDYDATREEISEAYQRLLQENEGKPEILRLLKEGWAILGSNSLRAQYDQRNEIPYLRAARQQMRRPPPTLVDPLGRAAPHTVVMPDPGQGPPRTEVMPDPGQGPLRTVVMPEPGQGSSPTVVLPDSNQGTPGAVDLGEFEAPIAPALIPVAPPAPAIAVSVMVQSPAGAPWSKPLPPGEYVIGRKSTQSATISDIQLDDPDRFMSRRHAAIIVQPDGCFVRDERSRNGTYVNGHVIPLGRMAQLSNGDRIGIEAHVLIVTIQPVT